MSSPHFYQGDDSEREKLIGLNPNKDEHETILDIEPVSWLKILDISLFFQELNYKKLSLQLHYSYVILSNITLFILYLK